MSIKNNTKKLVEYILEDKLVEANELLKTLVVECEDRREKIVADALDKSWDPLAINKEITVEDSLDDAEPEVEEAPAEPEAEDATLGDSLHDSVEGDSEKAAEDDQLNNVEVTEMGNDVVDINCQINQKMISMLYDKVSTLKTLVNDLGLDKDGREYITYEVKLSYYANKLDELQSKTNPAVDQDKVKEHVDAIDEALKDIANELNTTEEEEAADNAEEVEDQIDQVEKTGEVSNDAEEENEEAGVEEAGAEEREVETSNEITNEQV